MDVKTGLFYVFAALTLFSGFRVVTARNPVHSALFLILTFVSAAVIWLLLKAEFLAIVLVLVYIGAVMVLFLFVVMMLDIDVETLKRGFWKNFPMAAVIAVFIIVQMAAVLMSNFTETEALPMRGMDGAVLAPNASNTTELGKLLYTHYLYPLEIAAVLLLVAMISAIALTMRKRKDSKFQSPAEQVRVRPQDRMRIVKMDITKPAPVAADPAADAEEKKA